MTLIRNAKNEFQKSPIIVTCTVGGLIVATTMLMFAINSPPSTTQLSEVGTSKVFFSLKNLLFCLAYYIFISLSAVSLTRLLSKYHNFTATILSVPVAVIINFSTYIAVNLLPPTLFSKSQLLQISDLIYWCTLVLFVAFCGKSVMRIVIGTPDEKKKVDLELGEKQDVNISETDGNTVGGILFIFFICLFIWGKMVSYGQDTLISSLLPEIWQPVSEETVKNVVQESNNS